jgi:hypothetical protein
MAARAEATASILRNDIFWLGFHSLPSPPALGRSASDLPMAPKKSAKKDGGGDGSDDRVHVVVRIRPPVRKDEKFGEGSESLQYDKEKNMLFCIAKDDDGKANPKQYIFDRVLWKDSVQEDAWHAAGEPIVTHRTRHTCRRTKEK